MRVVGLPAEPLRPGKLSLHLDLDRAELEAAVQILRSAADGSSAAAPLRQTQTSGTAQQSSHQTQQPPPLPASAQRSGGGAAPPPVAPGQTSLPPHFLVHTSRSNAAEHGGSPVTALHWEAALPSLGSRGDAHAGWLVSASRGVLNLWECEPGFGVGGEPALTLMHSTTCPFRPTCLAVDATSGIILAGAANARTGVHRAAVSLHSLLPDNFLAMLGAIKPPAPLGGAAPPPGVPLLAASLSCSGGPLVGCAAIAFGKEVSVTSLSEGVQGASVKAHWRASPAGPPGLHISALAPWPSAPLLLTGTSDGGLQFWDMRTKPRGNAQPAAGCASAGGGGVVAVAVPAAATALSVTESGEVCLWDVRNAGGSGAEAGWRMLLSRKTAVGADAPLRAAALCALTGDAVAAVTGGVAGPGKKAADCSLFAALMQATGENASFGPFAKLALPKAVAAPREASSPGFGGGALAWGKYGQGLYAGGSDGSICVFRS